MKKLKEIVKKLRLAINAIGDVPSRLKDVPAIDTEENKLALGRLLFDMGEFLEKIYKIAPSLRSEYSAALKENDEDCLKIDTLLDEAFALEKAGQEAKAEVVYKTILRDAALDDHLISAQAGLYRIGEKKR